MLIHALVVTLDCIAYTSSDRKILLLNGQGRLAFPHLFETSYS